MLIYSLQSSRQHFFLGFLPSRTKGYLKGLKFSLSISWPSSYLGKKMPMVMYLHFYSDEHHVTNYLFVLFYFMCNQQQPHLYYHISLILTLKLHLPLNVQKCSSTSMFVTGNIKTCTPQWTYQGWPILLQLCSWHNLFSLTGCVTIKTQEAQHHIYPTWR